MNVCFHTLRGRLERHSLGLTVNQHLDINDCMADTRVVLELHIDGWKGTKEGIPDAADDTVALVRLNDTSCARTPFVSANTCRFP